MRFVFFRHATEPPNSRRPIYLPCARRRVVRDFQNKRTTCGFDEKFGRHARVGESWWPCRRQRRRVMIRLVGNDKPINSGRPRFGVRLSDFTYVCETTIFHSQSCSRGGHRAPVDGSFRLLTPPHCDAPRSSINRYPATAVVGSVFPISATTTARPYFYDFESLFISACIVGLTWPAVSATDDRRNVGMATERKRSLIVV